MGDGGRDACSGGATSTPTESTLPARPGGDGRHVPASGAPCWRDAGSAGEPAVPCSSPSSSLCALAAVTRRGAASRWRQRRRRDGPVAGRRSASPCSPSWSSSCGRRPCTTRLAPDELGDYVGWATVAADPDPASGRLGCCSRSRASASRCGCAAGRRGCVSTPGSRATSCGSSGTRRPARRRRGRRGSPGSTSSAQFDPEVLGDRRDGRRLDVASNRVRGLITAATSALRGDDGALARGLIIGDDSDQPEAMTARFRHSGLSHLTAVSGQNVALALSIAAPLLQRVRPVLRLAATLAVIGWFVVLTRAEPSVLRAGTMAALAALAFAVGGEREPPRLLAAAVVILLLVDPLLVRSVGFWLSVGATAGVTIVGPPLRRRLAALGAAGDAAGDDARRPARRASSRASSCSGSSPSIGIVANLAAVPVAGLVMLYGLPASLVAGAVPAAARRADGAGRRRDPVGRPRRRRRRRARAAPAVERRGVRRRPASPSLRRAGAGDRDGGASCDNDADERPPPHGRRRVDPAGGRQHAGAVARRRRRSGVDGRRVRRRGLHAWVPSSTPPTRAPFLTERRVVVARAAGRFTADELAVLVGYLADPLPSTELVIEWGSQRRPKAFDEALTTAGATITSTAPPNRARDRSAWVQAEAKAADVRLNGAAVDAGRRPPRRERRRRSMGSCGRCRRRSVPAPCSAPSRSSRSSAMPGECRRGTSPMPSTAGARARRSSCSGGCSVPASATRCR